MGIKVVDPEWGIGNDWHRSVPPWKYIQPLGQLLEDLLGPSGQNSPESRIDLFSFPHIFRRVETLSVLSEIGEKRHLSLDMDVGYVRNLVGNVSGSGIDKYSCPRRLPLKYREISYGDYIPVPFGVFRKGILHAFSASDEKKYPLSLVGRSVCLMAGLAWCFNCLPRNKIHELESKFILQSVLDYVWEIVQFVPHGHELSQVDDPHVVPDWWKRPQRDRSQMVWDSTVECFLNLTGMDKGILTTFRRRLRLLSANFFPLLLIPQPSSGVPHSIIKVEWVYGRPAEEWARNFSFKSQWEERKNRYENSKEQHYEGPEQKSLGPLYGLRGWFRNKVIPHGPWPYDIGLFGDLEGHCEHLNVEIPSGVELVGGCFLNKDEWPSGHRLRKAERDSGDKYSPKFDVPIDQFMRNDPSDTFDDAAIDQFKTETLFKMERHSVSIRRHKSLPNGQIKLRMSIAPSLDGIFFPASVSLGALLVIQIMLLSFNHAMGGKTSSSVSLQALPLLTPLIAGVGSFIINRQEEPLRALMLGKLLGRVYFALIAGAASVFLYSFIVGSILGQHKSSCLNPIWYMILVVGTGIVLYSLCYLIHSRLQLWRARMRVRDRVGHTDMLSVKTNPSEL